LGHARRSYEKQRASARGRQGKLALVHNGILKIIGGIKKQLKKQPEGNRSEYGELIFENY